MTVFHFLEIAISRNADDAHRLLFSENGDWHIFARSAAAVKDSEKSLVGLSLIGNRP